MQTAFRDSSTPAAQLVVCLRGSITGNNLIRTVAAYFLLYCPENIQQIRINGVDIRRAKILEICINPLQSDRVIYPRVRIGDAKVFVRMGMIE